MSTKSDSSRPRGPKEKPASSNLPWRPSRGACRQELGPADLRLLNRLAPPDTQIPNQIQDRRKHSSPTLPEIALELGIEPKVPLISLGPTNADSTGSEGSLLPDCDRITDITRLSVDPPHSNVTPRDRAILLRMDGPMAGEVFSLEQGSVRIGRHSIAEVALPDEGLSRVHAQVFRDGPEWFVEDQGSTNGTYVEGERIARRKLHDGDIVQLGPRVAFSFTLVDSRREAVLHELFNASRIDSLTGTFNRKHFDQCIEEAVKGAVQRGTPLSLLLFDLDHFKQVNDTYGHPAGDAVLKYVSGLTKQGLRSADVVARYGGEEFGVLLRDTSLKAAAGVAERIRVTVSTHPAHYSGQHIPVSISIGCASLGCCIEKTPSALVALADQRLYLAKNQGRNRVVSG